MRDDAAGAPQSTTSPDFEDEGLSLLDLAVPLAEHLKLLIIGPILAGLVALGMTYLITPTFTARTIFLPPQQQQSAAASALSSLGALAGLAGAATGIKSPAEQYVALMESATASDRIIDEFKLMQVYDEEYRIDARKKLAKNVRMAVGRKDGLISVEVDDESPQRAAAMANRYVDELRRLTSQLAITEAQQRRVFFEQELAQTRDRLTAAQQSLQASGFNPGAIKAEPKAAAEGYAKLRAEVTAAEVRLQALRRAFSDNTPEVQQQLAALSALRGQLTKVEAAADTSGDADYVGRYREFKYQETLFELYARQYELARADESREGALIQVVDVAKPPEKKSWPKRALTAAATWAGALLLLGIGVLVRYSWRESSREPQNAEKIARLRAAFGRR
jgi:capsule polysaccharide export protein KpsE/RkpR